jgi:hypothetical protein
VSLGRGKKFLLSGGKVIKASNLIPLQKKSIDKIAADEPGASGNEDMQSISPWIHPFGEIGFVPSSWLCLKIKRGIWE